MKNDDDDDEDAVDDAPILCCAFCSSRDNQAPFYVLRVEWWCTWALSTRSLLLLIKNLMKRINFLKISSHFAFACIKIMMTTTTAMMMMFQTTIKLKFSLPETSWKKPNREENYFKHSIIVWLSEFLLSMKVSDDS